MNEQFERLWAREMRDADGVRHGQKESARWIEGYERVAEMAANMAHCDGEPGAKTIWRGVSVFPAPSVRSHFTLRK